MQKSWFLFSITFVLATASAQQSLPAASIPQLNLQSPENVKLMNGVPDLTEPSLLSLHFDTPPKAECRGQKQNGNVAFSLVVDGVGRPRNIVFKHVLGNDVDSIAIQIAEADHFRPAMVAGTPGAVEGILEIRLQTCTEPTTGPTGAKGATIRLISIPAQNFETLPRAPDEAHLAPIAGVGVAPQPALSGYGDVLSQRASGIPAPKPLHSPAAEDTVVNAHEQTHESCPVSMTVDEHGMPQDIMPARTAGAFGMVGMLNRALSPAALDREISPAIVDRAFQAARRWRFMPATKDGMPVAVRIVVILNANYL